MKSVIVTLITNVMQLETPKVLDENGNPTLCHDNFAFDVDGMPLLVDEEDVGMIMNTQAVPVNFLDQATNTLQTSVAFRAEVLWNKRRCPAPAIEDPNNLVFLSIDDPDTEEDFESDDDDTEEYEELEHEA